MAKTDNAVTYPTSLGTSDADHIRLLGHDVAEELMGKVGFGELAFWLVAERRPTAGQVRLFEAILVSLADHGLTPTVIAARMTYYGAPDSIQGAVAAGLLGAGSRFLGVTEDAGKLLNRWVVDLARAADDWQGADWDALALRVVTEAHEAGVFIPGLGHRMHKSVDPRVSVLVRIAREEGLYGRHLALMEAIGRTNGQVFGRSLPLNAAGIAGAALADLGLPIEMLRGFSLLARTAGLVGQIAEEQRRPLAPTIYSAVDGNALYVAPEA
jgi:citrate synthase